MPETPAQISGRRGGLKGARSEAATDAKRMVKQPPAMAAGLTDHVWTLHEIAALLDSNLTHYRRPGSLEFTRMLGRSSVARGGSGAALEQAGDEHAELVENQHRDQLEARGHNVGAG